MALEVIKGGKGNNEDYEYRYMSGEVSDTRLMGVIGLHLHWNKKRKGTNDHPTSIHQFIYYDVEEIGLDYIRSVVLEDPEAIDMAKKASFGGLGARMRPLTENESRYLVCWFVQQNKKRKLSLPDNISDVDFILNNPVSLSEDDIKYLTAKMCQNLVSDYGIINYYLMRCFGHDPEGAALLADGNSKCVFGGEIALKKQGTFLKNRITSFTDAVGRDSYLCESIVEAGDVHYMVLSEIAVEGGRVTFAKKNSSFKLSEEEVAKIISKAEYVSVYEILSEMEDFDVDFAIYSLGCTKTLHDTGEMFMQFNDSNIHVERPVYSLSDDVKAIYYVTDYGQLIVGAYSLGDIMDIEKKIASSPVGALVCITGKFQFNESVIYEFALSGFTDFGEFISNFEE